MKDWTWNPEAGFKWLVALASAQWLSLSVEGREALFTLCGMIAVDSITGFWASWVNREVDSAKMRRGYSKKLATICALLFVHWMEQRAHIELHAELVGALAFSFNEAISIIENFSRLGVPIPESMIEYLMRFKKFRLKMASTQQIKALRDPEPPASEVDPEEFPEAPIADALNESDNGLK